MSKPRFNRATGLWIITAVFGEPRKGASRARVLYPDPSFVYYGIAARAHGVEALEVPLDANMELDFELVEDVPSLANDGRPKRWVVVRP